MVSHSQKEFELKGLHREKWETIQDCEKDKAGSGPITKIFDGEKKMSSRICASS